MTLTEGKQLIWNKITSAKQPLSPANTKAKLNMRQAELLFRDVASTTQSTWANNSFNRHATGDGSKMRVSWTWFALNIDRSSPPLKHRIFRQKIWRAFDGFIAEQVSCEHVAWAAALFCSRSTCRRSPPFVIVAGNNANGRKKECLIFLAIKAPHEQYFSVCQIQPIQDNSTNGLLWVNKPGFRQGDVAERLYTNISKEYFNVNISCSGLTDAGCNWLSKTNAAF